MVLKPPPSEVMSVRVQVGDMSAAAQGRRVAVELAQSLGFSEADAGRTALVVTEAATNLVEHAGGGEVVLRSMAIDAGAGLEMLALDKGPGIANVSQCMVDGYSTRDSRGGGLGAIKRQSTTFDIYSLPGKGTAILSRIEVRPTRERRSVEERMCWGAVCLPMAGESVCGDAWIIHDLPGRSNLMVVDGVGHGLHAFDAAQHALDAFSEFAAQPPSTILHALNSALVSTRGAVALLVEVDWRTRRMNSIGLGNISARLVLPDQSSLGLVSHPGTLGQRMYGNTTPLPSSILRAQEFERDWPDGALLILHSDGLSSRWDLADYPGLSHRDPSLIAGVLYRDYYGNKDDVTVLVCRERSVQTSLNL